MGIHADIYRSRDFAWDPVREPRPTKGVTLVNVDGPFEPSDEYPAALLVEGNVPGAVKVVPADPAPEIPGTSPAPVPWVARRAEGDKTIGPMFGGCFVYTSDSRFAEKVAELGGGHYGAVDLHDRFETPAQNEALSR